MGLQGRDHRSPPDIQPTNMLRFSKSYLPCV
jgi:hypothetical protein